ncbi:TetR/AcrR family transcriptional regulator [Melaminivora alkalimesophila]|uniref:TetR family transcriptional regulator n=1 Tax=Melaminivora alkalimesophila TaxID=1165852 RepID=A0A317RGR9_9BURK|nr:TetR/AcrR family transcriptional regulator [Melaminivora alkalimesophila]PWW48931.1 TetR family transcriptional regulator [Melaminivora alkalimesophila]
MLDWRDFSTEDLDAPLRAARHLFARHGYHGTSIRAIAEGAGLSVPGLYHHYPSKQVILEKLVGQAIGQMLAHTRAADAASDGSALNRFDHVVECLLRFHLQRREDAFIASSEMRSMDPAVRRAHVAQRDEQQAMLQDILEQGATEGVFHCAHPRDAARAIASLCVSVASWYAPGGSLSTDQVVERYLSFARGIAGAPRPCRD